MALSLVAVLVGATIASSLLDISLDISEKVSRELRAYGANILVEPSAQTISIQIGGVNYAPIAERSYLNADQVSKIKTIFWRNQIVGVAPFLYGVVEIGGRNVVLAGTWFQRDIKIPFSTVSLPNGTVIKRAGESFTTGIRGIAPWWQIRGEWLSDTTSGGAIVGEEIAQVVNIQIGDEIAITYDGRRETLKVKGVVATGGFEDQQVFVTLEDAQRILRAPNAVDKILVSALVKPDDELARKPHDKMTSEEHVVWYCSPYIGAITYQIEEAIGYAKVKPIRQVSEAEGKVLSQTQLIFLLIAASALSVSAIGVASTMMTTVVERRKEIALMKALGAEESQIALQFIADALIVGLVGGVLGYLLGNLLAQFIGASVFDAVISPSVFSLPVTLGISIGVAFLGSLLPARRASAIVPASVLKGE